VRQILKSILQYFKDSKEKHSETQNDWDEKIINFTESINYKFQNISLLKAALTHSSFIKRTVNVSAISPFERMEFLGDSILGLVVAERLFTDYPEKQEGHLSKMKSKLVSEKFLYLKAKKIELGKYILMSDDEERSGGRERASIVSDMMESLICALYLDGGYEASKNFICNFIMNNYKVDIQNDNLKNYKSILQEYCQSKYQKPPDYETISEEGPEHLKKFRVIVLINKVKHQTGVGRTKKAAQQEAAKNTLKELNIL